MAYPDYESFAYGFNRGELSIAKNIVSAISNISFDQPTTEGVVMGTKPWPLLRTEGNMGLGAGSITFSDVGEMVKFLKKLGNGWRSKKWQAAWTIKSEGLPTIKFVCISCRVLSNPIAHGQGDEGLTADLPFSFMSHTIDGNAPHKGMPTG